MPWTGILSGIRHPHNFATDHGPEKMGAKIGDWPAVFDYDRVWEDEPVKLAAMEP